MTEQMYPMGARKEREVRPHSAFIYLLLHSKGRVADKRCTGSPPKRLSQEPGGPSESLPCEWPTAERLSHPAGSWMGNEAAGTQTSASMGCQL